MPLLEIINQFQSNSMQSNSAGSELGPAQPQLVHDIGQLSHLTWPKQIDRPTDIVSYRSSLSEIKNVLSFSNFLDGPIIDSLSILVYLHELMI